jgi:WD40 repeat protein
VIEPETGREKFAVKRDKAGVTAAVWVGEEPMLALGLADGVVELVDGSNGKSAGRLELGGAWAEKAKDHFGKASAVHQLAISPDGKIAVVQYGQRNGIFGVWDLPGRKLRHLTETRIGTACLALAVTADNRFRIAFQGRELSQCDLMSFDVGPAVDLKAAFKPWAGHTGLAITERGVFSADGKSYAQAAAWSNDVTNAALKTEVYAQSKKMGPTVRGLPALAFSPDGRILVTGGMDCALRFWDVETGKAVGDQTEHAASVLALAVSPDQRLLATGSEDHKIRIREIATGKVLQVLEGPMRSITGLCFLPDNKTLVSRSTEIREQPYWAHTLRTWDWTMGKVLAEMAVPRGTSPLVCTQDGRYISYTNGGGLTFIDLTSKKSVEPPHGAYARELLPGLRFAVTDWDGYSIPATTTGFPSIDEKVTRGIEAGQSRWHCAAFGSDGKTLVTSLRHQLALVDSIAGKEIRRLTPTSEPAPQPDVRYFRHVLFTPDGKRVIAVQDVHPETTRPGMRGFGIPKGDQEIQVWDAATGARIAALGGHQGPIHDLALAENGRALFTAGADGTVLLWDLEGGPAPAPIPSDASGLATRMFGADELAAVQAMQALVADPEKAAQVVREWLSSLPPNETAAKLVAELANADLAKRLAAIQALAALRDKDATIEAHLIRAVLKPDAGESTRLCALTLLDAYYNPATREHVSLLRVIKLSEWLADDAAKDRLKLFGQRLPKDRGGRAAREALKRIAAGIHRQEFAALAPLSRPAGAVAERRPLRLLTPPEPKP